jgi:hypothetical protein
MYPNLDFWFENKPSGNPGYNYIHLREQKKVIFYRLIVFIQMPSKFFEQIGRFFPDRESRKICVVTNDEKHSATRSQKRTPNWLANQFYGGLSIGSFEAVPGLPDFFDIIYQKWWKYTTQLLKYQMAIK